uniref:Uncharacterized protein n=1 Tax=Romanomermis culicivorax TaxID=13658 RepID=A0A915HMW9_ROMCU
MQQSVLKKLYPFKGHGRTTKARSIQLYHCSKDKQGILMQQSELKKLYPFKKRTVKLQGISKWKKMGWETSFGFPVNSLTLFNYAQQNGDL